MCFLWVVGLVAFWIEFVGTDGWDVLSGGKEYEDVVGELFILGCWKREI